MKTLLLILLFNFSSNNVYFDSVTINPYPKQFYHTTEMDAPEAIIHKAPGNNNGNHKGWDNPNNPHYNSPIEDLNMTEIVVLLISYLIINRNIYKKKRNL